MEAGGTKPIKSPLISTVLISLFNVNHLDILFLIFCNYTDCCIKLKRVSDIVIIYGTA